jgi:hypothetical protein
MTMTTMGLILVILALGCALAAYVLGQLAFGQFGEEGKL